MIEHDNNVSMPFNEAFQQAIIGFCLRNPSFFLKCNTRLKPAWFTKSVMLSNIFDQMQTYYKEYAMPPKAVDDLLNQKFFRLQSEDDYDKYKAVLDLCLYQASDKGFPLENIKKNLTGFLRLCMFKEAVEGAAKKFNGYGLTEAYNWTQNRLSLIQDASFEDDSSALSFDNPRDWLLEELTDSSKAISTGSKFLDFALGGGLFKGETTAIMAPVNSGKSTVMITMARHAIMQGLNVMFLTHEDSPKKIRRKILQSFLGVTKETLTNPEILKDKNFNLDLEACAAKIKNHLTYLPYSKINGMYIEDVALEIEQRHKDLIQKTGRGFDIIIDDYPKKLRTKNRNAELYRAELAQVYDVFNQIAIELNVHCFLAIQTNREGLKQNMGKVKQETLVGMDLVDESYGIAQNMGNIITLNRSPDDKRHNIVRLNVSKSRNDITDIAVVTRTAYGSTITHGDADMFPGTINFEIADNAGKLHKIERKISIPRDCNGLAAYGQSSNVWVDTVDADRGLRAIEKGDITLDQALNDFKKGFMPAFKDKDQK